MSTIRSKLKELVDILSELNNPPPPTAPFSSAMETYLKTLKDAKRQHQEEEAARDLFAELINVDEATARQKLDQLSDADFKKFCSINRVDSVKGRKEKHIRGKVIQKATKGKAEKRVRGKVIQRAVNAKRATKGKPAQAAIPERREPDKIIPAQPAIPEKREPDTIIPAQTDREATTEAIINRAFQLKNQATL